MLALLFVLGRYSSSYSSHSRSSTQEVCTNDSLMDKFAGVVVVVGVVVFLFFFSLSISLLKNFGHKKMKTHRSSSFLALMLSWSCSRFIFPKWLGSPQKRGDHRTHHHHLRVDKIRLCTYFSLIFGGMRAKRASLKNQLPNCSFAENFLTNMTYN